MSALQVNTVLLLDALQLLMLFVRTLTYLEPKLLLLILFYNGTFLLIKILCVFNVDVYIYFSHRIIDGMIILTGFLLLSNDTNCLVLSFVHVSVSLFVHAYFTVILWAAE
jgi:hypothetical protein